MNRRLHQRWRFSAVTQFQRNPLDSLIRAEVEHGIAAQVAPGIFAVYGPELIHEVLRTTNDNFIVDSGRLAGARSRERRAANLPAWMQIRQDLWHGFDRHAIEAHVARTPHWISAWEANLRTDSHDLVDACRALCGAGLVDLCLGGTPEDADQRGNIRRAADRLFSFSLGAIEKVESRSRWWPKPQSNAADAANAQVVTALTDCIRRRASGHDRSLLPRDLLDVLLAKTDEGQLNSVLGALRMAIFASHGVPGVALSWVLVQLSTMPAVRTEIAAELQGTEITAAAVLRGLPYTRAVLQEVLRLNPPQWLLSRTATRSMNISGLEVKPGDEVVICPYLLHRDPSLWDNPHTFDPDRWHALASRAQRYSYLSFGSGTRVCPGARIGMLQLILALKHILVTGGLHIGTTDAAPTFSTLLQPAGATLKRHI